MFTFINVYSDMRCKEKAIKERELRIIIKAKAILREDSKRIIVALFLLAIL